MSKEYLHHDCSSYYSKPAKKLLYTYIYYPSVPGKTTPELPPQPPQKEKKKYSRIYEQFKSPYCPY